MLRWVLVSLLAAAVAAPAAWAATTDRVVMTDLKFALSKKTVPRGAVTFRLRNNGELTHDFKIAGKKSRTLLPGQSGTLKVIFRKPGRYAYICTIPGHAAVGMKGVLVVK
ncbi:MAG TPA: cupredoxin domain-containing protein [Gaiellaceae bacterium]|nr:cupredoxin domain-containing protein [Gaiellaceae bacterium]